MMQVSGRWKNWPLVTPKSALKILSQISTIMQILNRSDQRSLLHRCMTPCIASGFLGYFIILLFLPLTHSQDTPILTHSKDAFSAQRCAFRESYRWNVTYKIWPKKHNNENANVKLQTVLHHRNCMVNRQTKIQDCKYIVILDLYLLMGHMIKCICRSCNQCS